MQADRVRDTALIVLRRDDPDLPGELAGDPLEDCETWRLDAVVIVIKMRSSIMRLLLGTE